MSSISKFQNRKRRRSWKKRLPGPSCPDNKSLYTFKGDIQNCPARKKVLQKTKVAEGMQFKRVEVTILEAAICAQKMWVFWQPFSRSSFGKEQSSSCVSLLNFFYGTLTSTPIELDSKNKF